MTISTQTPVSNSDLDEKRAAIWKQIASAIQPHISPDTYQRWFAGITLVLANDEALTLRVPSQIYQFWIETNFMNLLQSAILTTLQTNPKILFVHSEEETPTRAETEVSPAKITVQSTAERTSETDSFLDGPVTPNGINPRNTFASVVVGSHNEHAHAAALAVSQAPTRVYNPLFIYGGTGLGKTHLMHAIGHAVIEKKKNAKIVYLTSEQFTNEFIDAIQNHSLVKFRKRYRNADVLLIDDIQFFGGNKEKSQEEFFHTFNTLMNAHKQIVLSSDRPPSEIPQLEQRLVSRFEGGLTADIQAPDTETRLAILRKKAQALNITIAPDILEYLAEHIRSNVRRLEGALMRVASYASLSGKALDRPMMENLLKDFLAEEARQTVTVDQIQRRVAEGYDIRLADMTSKRRPSNIAFPRQIAMYLARKRTKLSLSEIGDAFGGRDHGTVIHACHTVEDRMKTNEDVRRKVNALNERLQR